MKDKVSLKTKKKAVLPKVLAGVTAGAAVGLVTYMLTKTDKAEKQTVEKLEINDKKENRLFI